jgi:ABC-type uncharacterized transport system auxiliary subunit
MPPGAPIEGLVRVRDLTAANVYESSQIVVRKNPYELQYSEDNVWAVKPSSMVSDVIARGLVESHRFTSVVRQLGELRPDYILGGDLHAIEVYDSGDVWFAHVSLTLQLTRFRTGESLYTLSFDRRQQLGERTFAQAARAISELLSAALAELIVGLERVDAPRLKRPKSGTPPVGATSAPPASQAPPAEGARADEAALRAAEAAPAGEKTIFVPEKKPEE